jgi:hypothetical protein
LPGQLGVLKRALHPSSFPVTGKRHILSLREPDVLDSDQMNPLRTVSELLVKMLSGRPTS